ncbi:MAG: hypothetical protein M9938_09145 [Solirubrobacterales bacterium]|nr:hypothetical protein [Solirubrobacterales bacterium]
MSEAVDAIFTGLQTSADPIYIVEDRGPGPNGRRVYSKESGRELELEPDLLHRLASGGDIDRWAIRPLGDLLIFPYRRGENEQMRLLTPEELAALPLTAAYLGEHEEKLRGRESKKMDHDSWYGYVYPKSLGLHDKPKLGVPRLCDRLHAVDQDGTVYLDNVDVNGILTTATGPGLWVLAAILNSRLPGLRIPLAVGAISWGVLLRNEAVHLTAADPDTGRGPNHGAGESGQGSSQGRLGSQRRET